MIERPLATGLRRETRTRGPSLAVISIELYHLVDSPRAVERTGRVRRLVVSKELDAIRSGPSRSGEREVVRSARIFGTLKDDAPIQTDAVCVDHRHAQVAPLRGRCGKIAEIGVWEKTQCARWN